jgi:hypothetical protein
MSEKAPDRLSWGPDVVLTQCMLCKHDAKGPHNVCAAFPGQIPPEILVHCHSLIFGSQD